MKKLNESIWDSEEIINDLLLSFGKGKKAKDLIEIRKELEETLDLEGGDYSSYGNCGSFEFEGTEYNIIENYDEAISIAEQKVKEDLENEPELFNPDFISRYITVSHSDKDQIAQEESEAHTSDVRDYIDSDELEKACEELEIDYADYEEKIDSEDEEVSEKAKEELLTELESAYESKKDSAYQDIYNKLEDPIDYFINELGAYEDVSALLKASFITIDINEASEAAVSEDGWEHFLSTYDGNSKETDNGFVYFRK